MTQHTDFSRGLLKLWMIQLLKLMGNRLKLRAKGTQRTSLGGIMVLNML
ncbi:Scm-like with four MBT domains protein 1 [Bienertia sinuspersici]